MPSSLSLTTIMFLLLAVAASLIGTLVDAYPTGPPLIACTSMTPTGHGASTVSGDNPFTFSLSKTTYMAGEEIQVTLSGATFIGFFVQARRSDSGSDMDSAVGTFGGFDTTNTKTLSCNGPSSAWSHKNKGDKSSMTATWIAPSSDEGTIAFRATVVQGPGSSKYWESLFSSEITFNSGSGGGGNTTTSSGMTNTMATGGSNTDAPTDPPSTTDDNNQGNGTPTPTGRGSFLRPSGLTVVCTALIVIFSRVRMH